MPDRAEQSRGDSSPDSREPARGEARRKGPPPTIVVRYGRMNHVGEFHLPKSVEEPAYGSRVVVQTDRGVEIGDPVRLTRSTCPNAVSREQMRTYVKNSGADFLRFQAGRVLRRATADDLIEQRHIDAQKREKMEACKRLVSRHGLDMKLVDCEHILGGERIVFYFMAESRVDFRALVKDLADEFQTRIEMRQIGARDEARLAADYETCGRECCCKNFLKILKPVSMRMAKMQKATLDPSKVSGRCGRLKCCLRYEQETYEELEARLPRIGQRVNTTEGEGVVTDRQVLTQLLQLEGDAGQVFAVGAEQVLVPGESPPVDRQSKDAALDGGEGAEWKPFDAARPRPPATEPGQAEESADQAKEKPPPAEASRADPAGAGKDESEAAPAKSKRRRRRGRRGRGRQGRSP